MTPIWFKSKSDWPWLSNFSPNPVIIGGRAFRTVEHCYQSAKFSWNSEMFDRVCNAATPAEAKCMASASSPLEHWPAIREHVMRAALSAKFAQHPDLLDRLLSTGDRPLVHETEIDLVWGRRHDGTGANRLGEMLQDLRRDLRARQEKLDSAQSPVDGYPEHVVIHIPHDATFVPPSVRPQYLLDDLELAREITRVTDHRTLDLFTTCGDLHQVVRAPVSRLVVDCERFADEREVLMSRGMGAIYEVTCDLAPLRRPVDRETHERLLGLYYEPHHWALKAAVNDAVRRKGRCVILDCHSYPNDRLPYEISGQDARRPDVCLGADEDHTSRRLLGSFIATFTAMGWSTAVNEPFAGTIVPDSMIGKEQRVQSIMVEVNRRIYMQSLDEAKPDFDRIAAVVRRCCIQAIGAAS